MCGGELGVAGGADRVTAVVVIRAYSTALLLNNGQQRALIVAGDLNDEPQAATTQRLVQAIRPG